MRIFTCRTMLFPPAESSARGMHADPQPVLRERWTRVSKASRSDECDIRYLRCECHALYWPELLHRHPPRRSLPLGGRQTLLWNRFRLCHGEPVKNLKQSYYDEARLIQSKVLCSTISVSNCAKSTGGTGTPFQDKSYRHHVQSTEDNVSGSKPSVPWARMKGCEKARISHHTFDSLLVQPSARIEFMCVVAPQVPPLLYDDQGPYHLRPGLGYIEAACACGEGAGALHSAHIHRDLLWIWVRFQ